MGACEQAQPRIVAGRRGSHHFLFRRPPPPFSPRARPPGGRDRPHPASRAPQTTPRRRSSARPTHRRIGRTGGASPNAQARRPFPLLSQCLLPSLTCRSTSRRAPRGGTPPGAPSRAATRAAYSPWPPSESRKAAKSRFRVRRASVSMSIARARSLFSTATLGRRGAVAWWWDVCGGLRDGRAQRSCVRACALSQATVGAGVCVFGGVVRRQRRNGRTKKVSGLGLHTSRGQDRRVPPFPQSPTPWPTPRPRPSGTAGPCRPPTRPTPRPCRLSARRRGQWWRGASRGRRCPSRRRPSSSPSAPSSAPCCCWRARPWCRASPRGRPCRPTRPTC